MGWVADQSVAVVVADLPVEDRGAALSMGDASVAIDPLSAQLVEPIERHFTQLGVHGLCLVCKSVR
jgi:hypothetical protein